jgi:hypothetical protein
MGAGALHSAAVALATAATSITQSAAAVINCILGHPRADADSVTIFDSVQRG